MTIDEAIRHCLNVAETCTVKACANDHRQLATWLKDYKRLLVKESGVDIRCGNCKHDGSGDGVCGKCYAYSAWEGEL